MDNFETRMNNAKTQADKVEVIRQEEKRIAKSLASEMSDSVERSIARNYRGDE